MSDDELVLYTNPQSRGRIVRWMLEEVGRPYRTELLEFGTMKAPAYRAINPMAKVPALKHGEAIRGSGSRDYVWAVLDPQHAPGSGAVTRWCMCGRPLGCKRKSENSDGWVDCDHVSGLIDAAP